MSKCTNPHLKTPLKRERKLTSPGDVIIIILPAVSMYKYTRVLKN